MATVLAISACTGATSPSPATSPSTPIPKSAATTPTPSSAGAKSGARWKPAQGQTWQIQYSGTVDTTVKAAVYNLDWYETSKQTVDTLHRRGAKVICYVNAGGYEKWRADAKAFPTSTLGKPLDNWPGERWLDLRKRSTLIPIMAKRMDTCRAKGFDAVDPDNMDGYATKTGFPLTRADAVAYERQLAAEAHKRNLAIGLKNSLEILPQLVGDIDFAVNEECVAYDECSRYAPLLAAKKPVFNVEYQGTTSTVCRRVPKGMSTIIKPLELTARRTSC